MALNQQEFERLKTLVSTTKNLGTKTSDTEPSYLERLKTGFVKESLDIGEGVQRGAELMEQGKSTQGSIRAGLATAGGVARIIFSPITEALSPLISPLVEKAASNEQAQSILKNIDSWAKQNPDAAANLKNIVDIASSVTGAKGAKVATPVIKSGAAKTTEKVGTSLKSGAEKVVGLTITPQETTAMALASYNKSQPTLLQRLFGAKSVGEKPITEANSVLRNNVFGTEYGSGIRAGKVQDKIFSQIISPKLDKVKNAVNMRQFISELEKDIKKIPGLSERNNLLEGLAKFKEDYGNVGIISGRKLQQYKEDWAKFLPDASYKGKPIANSLKAVKDMAASKARPTLYKIVGEDGKQAYIDYGNLKSVYESGYKSTIGDVAKKLPSRNVWQFVMDQAVTPVATVGGQVLYRLGNGLEFIGKKGAKKVGDIINN